MWYCLRIHRASSFHCASRSIEPFNRMLRRKPDAPGSVGARPLAASRSGTDLIRYLDKLFVFFGDLGLEPVHRLIRIRMKLVADEGNLSFRVVVVWP